MSYYVITQVKVEDGEVSRAVVCKVVRSESDPPGMLRLAEGVDMRHPDIANLVDSDQVFVVKWTGPGEFAAGSRVSRKPGQHEYLVSIDENGAPNAELLEAAPLI